MVSGQKPTAGERRLGNVSFYPMNLFSYPRVKQLLSVAFCGRSVVGPGRKIHLYNREIIE